jgi:hypothetical protein
MGWAHPQEPSYLLLWLHHSYFVPANTILLPAGLGLCVSSYVCHLQVRLFVKIRLQCGKFTLSTRWTWRWHSCAETHSRREQTPPAGNRVIVSSDIHNRLQKNSVQFCCIAVEILPCSNQTSFTKKKTHCLATRRLIPTKQISISNDDIFWQHNLLRCSSRASSPDCIAFNTKFTDGFERV